MPTNAKCPFNSELFKRDISTPHGKGSAWQSLGGAKKAAGFSLIEILVAFSILALALGVLLNIFSSGLRSAMLSEENQQALAIAESQLERMGVEVTLQNGSLQGVEQDKYYWSVQVSPFELPQAKNATTIDQQVAQIAIFKVQVSVEWEDGPNNRSIILNSLRLATQAPA